MTTWLLDVFAWLLAAMLLVFTLRRAAFMVAAWFPPKPPGAGWTNLALAFGDVAGSRAK